MARIGIFGGSFNPPHLGHTLAVEEFYRKLSLDRVLVIPAAVPPHKRLTLGSAGAGARLEMTRLAMRELPYVTVSDMELRREGPSYTVDTIALLREEYPDDELYLLMGTDMFLSFDRWRAPEAIAREVTLVAARRTADSRLEDQAETLRRTLGARVLLLDNDCLPYSSTSVRALLAFGCGEHFLAGTVADYIRRNGLYFVGKALRALPYALLEEHCLALYKPGRVQHALGTAQTARRLALQYGEDPDDAQRAGILHDITKALSPEEQLFLCKSYELPLNDFERRYPKTLHAKTGAAVAARVFGESEAVCSAVRWHTTGRAGMTPLEKILYLADYIEPNRITPGVDRLRALCAESLDLGMKMGLETVVRYLTERGEAIDENTVLAMEDLNKGGNT